MKNKLKILADLTKIKITVFVTLTTAVGFVAAAGKLNLVFVEVCLGLLLLACGSAVINHIQASNSTTACTAFGFNASLLP